LRSLDLNAFALREFARRVEMSIVYPFPFNFIQLNMFAFKRPRLLLFLL